MEAKAKLIEVGDFFGSVVFAHRIRFIRRTIYNQQKSENKIKKKRIFLRGIFTIPLNHHRNGRPKTHFYFSITLTLFKSNGEIERNRRRKKERKTCVFASSSQSMSPLLWYSMAHIALPTSILFHSILLLPFFLPTPLSSSLLCCFATFPYSFRSFRLRQMIFDRINYTIKSCFVMCVISA